MTESIIKEVSDSDLSCETTLEYYNGSVSVSRVEFHEPFGASHDYIEIPFSQLENFIKKVKNNIEEDNSNSRSPS